MIEVNGLSKKFCEDLKRSLLYGINDIGREILGVERKSERLRKSEFWALEDISFSIQKGQSVGLIGSNGAGKTTLLRIISGLIKPDSGVVKIRGRIAPLIALGAGFNPILTGRENIFVNMAILGVSKKDIKKNFDEVVNFAELDHALDMPVQSYSSGMAARLGFACAIFTNPDILLIDEVLAVGDIKFRAKCYRKLAELKAQNTTFILVSHSSQSILSICETAIYLSKGRLIKYGKATEIMNYYENELLNKGNNIEIASRMMLPEKKGEQSAGIDFLEIGFCDSDGTSLDYLVSGESVFLIIKCKVHHPINNVGLKIIIRELSFESMSSITLDSSDDNFEFNLTPGIATFKISLPYLTFKPGVYVAKLNINQADLHIYDVIESYKFNVVDKHLIMLNSTHFQQRDWEIIH